MDEIQGQLIVQLLAWSLGYLILATVLKCFSATVQLHSVVHCIAASIMTGFVFMDITPNYAMFGLDCYREILRIEHQHNFLLEQVAIHSAGYFVADTLDIYFDFTPGGQKRRIYVLHHVASLAGLCTVFFDSHVALWGLWLFEIGGVVHHIKHAAKIFRWTFPFMLMAEFLYHTVYVWSRCLLFINTTRAWFFLDQSSNAIMDVVCLLVVYVLVCQNMLWWFQNAQSAWRDMLDIGKKEDEMNEGDKKGKVD